MTAYPVRLAARVHADRQLLAPVTFVALALAVGVLAPAHPAYAAALAVSVCLVLLVAARVTFLLILLACTMFVESLSLGGGFHLDRLAGGFAAAVLFYIFFANRRLLQLQPNGLLVLVGCYGGWMLLSAYWATDAGVVFSELFSYVLTIFYMLAFALLLRSRQSLRAVLTTFSFGALLFGVVALVTDIASHGASRSSGLQGDPNLFAEYQVLALPAAVVLGTFQRRKSWRYFYYGIVGVIILSVVSSQSRGGLLALIPVLLATLVLPWRIFFRSARQRLSYVVSVVAMAAPGVFVGASGSFFQRVGTLLQGASASDRGSGRLDIWSAAWRVWKTHPWFGIGAYNFRAHSLDILQATPGVNTAAHYVVAGKEVHNAYLETLTELGVVGLGLFLLVVGLTASYFLRAFRRASAAGDEPMRRMVAALLLGLVSVVITSFFLSNELGRALWIFVGLALALETATRSTSGPSRARRSNIGRCASARSP